MESNHLCCGRVLLSRRGFSALTGLSLRTISKLLASRELHSIRVGRRRLIPQSALMRFVKSDHSTQSVLPRQVAR